MSEKQIDILVAKTEEEAHSYMLDAIMFFSGSKSTRIRTTAFSTLSSLSLFSSRCRSVMSQIQRDINLKGTATSKTYCEFIEGRLNVKKEAFFNETRGKDVETRFSGLYSLLRLALNPSDEEIEAAMDKYIEFIKLPYDPENKDHVRNEGYFIQVFIALK
jgi:hypothetical protein